MQKRTYTHTTLAFVAAVVALLVLMPFVVGAQQNANTSKANKPSASTPTASRQDNSNKAARPNAQRSTSAAPTAQIKDDPGKMSYNRVTAQVVIDSTDAGHPFVVLVSVRNVSKWPSRGGTVSAGVVYLEDGPDPRKSKKMSDFTYYGNPKPNNDWGVGVPTVGVVRWLAITTLPALKPGESAQVQLRFEKPGKPAYEPPKDKWRLGVSVSAYEGAHPDDFKYVATFQDFLSAAFFGH